MRCLRVQVAEAEGVYIRLSKSDAVRYRPVLLGFILGKNSIDERVRVGIGGVLVLRICVAEEDGAKLAQALVHAIGLRVGRQRQMPLQKRKAKKTRALPFCVDSLFLSIFNW